MYTRIGLNTMDNMTATFLGVAHELLDERPLSCAYKNFNLHSRHDKTKIILINKIKLHASKQNSLVTRQNPLTGNERFFFSRGLRVEHQKSTS